MKKEKWNDSWRFWKEGSAEKQNVNLPHDAMLTETRQPDLPKGSSTGFFPGGKYWYEKNLFADAHLADQAVILEFEGVYMDARVYLNGIEVGGWIYGYTNFYVDLTGKLLPEQDNVITVLADNSRQPNSRWYSGSGIYRDVNLYIGSKEHILPDDIQVKTLSIDPAVLDITVKSTKEENTQVRVEVLDGNTTVATGTGEQLLLTVPDAKLWSAEEPNLYTVRAILERDGEILDEATIRTGIRTLAWDSRKGFQVNGKTVKLRGGCIHHDHGPLGACFYRKAEYRRVKKLKEIGYNALRYSHYPANRGFLEICDELGMYVLEETFDQWLLPQSDFDYAIHFNEEWRKDVTAAVHKAFSHPSVIMYCIGNEISDTGLPHGAAIAKAMTGLIKELDPTRPTTIAINPMLSLLAKKMAEAKAQGQEQQGNMGSAEFNDIVAMLPQILATMTPETVEELLKPIWEHMDIAGYNYSSNLLEGTHGLVPERVMLHCETFPSQIAQSWALVEKNDAIIGDFMWTAWDYLGEAGVGEPTYGSTQAPFSKDYPCQNAYIGTVDLTGEPEPFAYYLAALWSKESKPYIAVRPLDHAGEEYTLGNWRFTDAIHSWTWPGYEGKTTQVEVYANAAEIALVLNGQEIGRAVPTACKAVLDAVYSAGTLEAVSYAANGEELGRSVLTTAGAESKLTVTAEEPSIAANGEDLAYVSVEITDLNGIRKNLCDCPVTIAVEGAGTLAAVGSATCRTEESYLSGTFTTHNGRMIAIVRSNGVPGSITVTAAAPGMEPVSLKIASV